MKCENCNEKLTGKMNFCSNCGQKSVENLNLKYILKDFFDNYFYIDSKLMKSIGSLLIRPGKLSLEFINGKRKSYLPPVRLYITLSVLFFFLITLIGSFQQGKEGEMLSLGFSYEVNGVKQEVKISPEKYQELELTNSFDDYIQDTLQVDSKIEMFFVKKMMLAQYNNVEFRETLMNQVSFFLLLFIPFIAFIYKLTFVKNKYSYIKHVVFNIHFNSFVLMLLILNEIASIFTDSYIGILLVLLISLVYLFIAIKRFYSRKKWVVLYKMIILLVGYLVSATVFSLLIFLVSLVFAK